MQTPYLRLPALTVLLSASSLAAAHGDGISGATLYHYLSSPDHVAIFALLALALPGIGIYRARRTALKNEERETL